LVPRSGTLKGALSGDRVLAVTCGLAASGERIGEISYVDCSATHNMEFAGVYSLSAGNVPDDEESLEQTVLLGCHKIVSGYLDWSSRQLDESSELGVTYWGPLWEDVHLGDRTFQCYAAVGDGWKLTASVKDLGGSPVPLAQ
jgi:hypothetical protein